MSTETILALEDRRYQAMIDADIATLDELCAPELVYTHSNAMVDTKESYLKRVEVGFFDYKWIEHPVDRVLMLDNTALVFGKMASEVIFDGTLSKLNNRSIAVWVRQGDAWQLVAYQPTPIREH